MTLDSLCHAGIPVERVIGLLAKTCEVQEVLAPMSTSDFLDALDPASLREWAGRTSAHGGDQLAPSDMTWLSESTT